VTVIETGFPKRHYVPEHADGKAFEVYPLKDFEPKKQKPPVTRELPIMENYSLKKKYDKDDYDIPAFLRRKAD
jgi:hypothetical protein